MNPDRPLDQVTSIKVKLGLLVGLSVIAAALVVGIGQQARVPLWLSLPVTIAAALGVTQWLARGMTAPLREMTYAASRLAAGDHTVPVTTTSNDEVGLLARSFTTMAAQLAAVDRQRRELVATVSHELRTPLAAQQALLENLADGVVQPDEATLRSALAQSERLGALVRDLLDLSRIDGGQTALRTTVLGVRAMLEESVAEGRLQGRDVNFTVDVEPSDLRVVGDPDRLSQVVANLLDNAIRHSPTGGEVRVTAGRDEGERWFLQVSDDGPGLPAGATDRLFSRFGTGDDTSGGTGLGLAIAAWVCDLHGGRISAVPTDADHPGATIRAVLPVQPPTRKEPIMTPSQPAEPGSATRTSATTAEPPPTSPAARTAYGSLPPAPPVIEPLFAERWPERDPAPQPRYVWSALAVGVVGAVVLPYRNLGVGVLAVLLLAGATIWHASPTRRSLWTLGSVVTCVALGLVVVLRDRPAVAILSVATAAAVAAVALTGARTLAGMVASGVAWVFSGMRGLPLLGRTLGAMTSQRLLWPVIRTAAISLVALVLFGGLFASADALLGAWAQRLVPDLAWSSLTLRTFVLVLAGGITLAGCYLALNPPTVDDLGLPAGRRTAQAWEWQVPLGLVIATYAAFLAAQGVALFGGHDYVQRTTGLTYADYVHQGFGQLTVVTVLTLAVVALVRRKASVEMSRDRFALRAMTAVLCVLTLCVVASALHRMSLYQSAYGWTTLRLFVDGFELWLGLLVACVLAAVLVERASWLPRAAVASGAAFTLGFGLLNPDGFVAAQNIARYHLTGKLDAIYLAQLGADAVPTIAGSSLPSELKACLVSAGTPADSDDALAWNLGRSRARSAADALGVSPASSSCTAAYGVVSGP